MNAHVVRPMTISVTEMLARLWLHWSEKLFTEDTDYNESCFDTRHLGDLGYAFVIG